MGVDVPVWFIIRGYSQSSPMPSEAGHENRVGTLSGEEGRSPEEAFGDWKSVRRVNTPDLLLHDLEGRYLWILIRVLGAGSDSSFTIEGFLVEFPWRSFVEYLPEHVLKELLSLPDQTQKYGIRNTRYRTIVFAL